MGLMYLNKEPVPHIVDNARFFLKMTSSYAPNPPETYGTTSTTAG